VLRRKRELAPRVLDPATRRKREQARGVRDVYLGAGRRPPERITWRTLPEPAADAIVDLVPDDPPETDLIMLEPLPPGLDVLERDPRWGGLLSRLGREVNGAVEAGLGTAVGAAVEQVAPTWQDAQQRPEVGALPRLGAFRPRMLRQLA
jgi:hypothetical protein